ncbi:MAG: hypothetical protein JWO62_2113 [Acidimicrobiaceae bacterium]|nr:hypothetical protein [Acidimicrobiaceae bacterium]
MEVHHRIAGRISGYSDTYSSTINRDVAFFSDHNQTVVAALI